jgi:plastocyanin
MKRVAQLCLVILIAAACGGLPASSRTGKVYEVVIQEGEISPRDVRVRPGDEVRFVNQRLEPVWVFFFRDTPDELACQRGFSYFWGTEESAKIRPNESASVCFSRPGAVGFSVQMEPPFRGGDELGALKISGAIPGAIVVE